MNEIPSPACRAYQAALLQHVLSGPVPEDPLARAPWLARLESLEDLWRALSSEEQDLVEASLTRGKETMTEAVLLTERFRG